MALDFNSLRLRGWFRSVICIVPTALMRRLYGCYRRAKATTLQNKNMPTALQGRYTAQASPVGTMYGIGF
ncbi:hypothetical protein [Microbacter margulisiae]|uniref:Uncharacterized protein n=1 Tax=Microbacter margulisiae TaxID=1350067 RepID=A0A7W5DQU2_9PORP|nr:hypothetical protein [Microbacter margulisiae]MBB3187387.1 hypothetical protein [Microbacter margulisiae]